MADKEKEDVKPVEKVETPKEEVKPTEEVKADNPEVAELRKELETHKEEVAKLKSHIETLSITHAGKEEERAETMRKDYEEFLKKVGK